MTHALVARTMDGTPIEYRNLAGGIEIRCGAVAFTLDPVDAEAHALRLLTELERRREAFRDLP